MTTPLPPTPPPGSDRKAWLRWAVLVAAILASAYFSSSQVEDLKKDMDAMKTMQIKTTNICPCEHEVK